MVGIGIITYNGAHRVEDLMQSIRKWHDPAVDYKVLLVDDGSPDVVPAQRVTEKFGIELIEHGENRGISAAWNTASRALIESGCEQVFLFNDDILVSEDYVNCMSYFLSSNPHAGSASWEFDFIIADDVPRILAADTAIRIYRDPHSKKLVDGSPQSVDHPPGVAMCPAGCCFGFTKEKFELAGGFHEGYKSFFEESDFGTTLAAAGHPTYIVPYPSLYHIWSVTFSENQELEPAQRGADSLNRYCERWDVPSALREDPFSFTSKKFMGRIGPAAVKWLSPTLEVLEGVLG